MMCSDTAALAPGENHSDEAGEDAPTLVRRPSVAAVLSHALYPSLLRVEEMTPFPGSNDVITW